ncbi:MAG: hypothetical protein QMC85_05050 [Methanocellales archaeon]|nr:hypothetical protein [Methanocellales archaeon]MDI6902911.1 hypothetical protein [Methanocellales archaeon]
MEQGYPLGIPEIADLVDFERRMKLRPEHMSFQTPNQLIKLLYEIIDRLERIERDVKEIKAATQK